MTGQDEVLCKIQKQQELFVLHLTADGRANHVLNLTNINNVTLVHIHQVRGTNGPIVVTLFKSTNPKVQINGTLSKSEKFFFQTNSRDPWQGNIFRI